MAFVTMISIFTYTRERKEMFPIGSGPKYEVLSDSRPVTDLIEIVTLYP